MLPEGRCPVHPGAVLLKDCIEPLGWTITETAERLKVSRFRLSELVNGKRSMTPDTALRIGRLFGTGPDIWMKLQVQRDLWIASQSADSKEIEEIEPVGT